MARRSRVDFEYNGVKYNLDPDTMRVRTAQNIDVDIQIQRQMLSDPTVRMQLLRSLGDADVRRLSSGITGPRAGTRSLLDRFRDAVGLNGRTRGDNIAANPSSKTVVDAGASAPGVVKARTAKSATQADAQKAVDDAVPDTPEGRKLKDDADELAKDPKVSQTLTKWGIRGGVGVIFLMMVYKTANPFEAMGKGAEDLEKGVKGLSELMSSIFEAFKAMISFLTNNWMVSAASSCCCALLIVLPLIMGSVQGMTPRRSRYVGGY